MAETYAIQIKGLTKFYGSFQALHGVDLDIRKGEIYGFWGRTVLEKRPPFAVY